MRITLRYSVFVHYWNWLDDDVDYRSPRSIATTGKRNTTFERPRSTVVVVVAVATTEFMYFLDNNFIAEREREKGSETLPSSITGHKLQWAAVVLIYDIHTPPRSSAIYMVQQ